MGFSSSARLAASTTGCGVVKSGSPISRCTTSWPLASTSRARVWISITSKGSMCAIREAMRRRGETSFMLRLSQVLVPELVQALGRDRERRAQLLREEAHAQLLDEPAEFLELRIAAARVVVGLHPRFVIRPQRVDGRRVLLVA